MSLLQLLVLLLSPLASLYIVEKLVRNFLEGAAQESKGKLYVLLYQYVQFDSLAWLTQNANNRKRERARAGMIEKEHSAAN